MMGSSLQFEKQNSHEGHDRNTAALHGSVDHILLGNARDVHNSGNQNINFASVLSTKVR
jgi:hypothetical protein